jgi:DNA-binding NarL/FixJ family response regulator
MPRRILIADDSALIRRIVRSYLEKSRDVEICGEASDGEQAVELVLKLNPEAVVLDFSMPTMNGLEAAQLMAELSPNTRVVLFTAHDTVLVRSRAVRAGVKAVVAKDGKASLEALKLALAGDEPVAA